MWFSVLNDKNVFIMYLKYLYNNFYSYSETFMKSKFCNSIKKYFFNKTSTGRWKMDMEDAFENHQTAHFQFVLCTLWAHTYTW